MAESSQNSAKSGKPSTRKTVKLTLEEALQILTQSFSYVEDAGGSLEVDGSADIVIVKIIGTRYVDGRIVPI